jgi:undecaprenyl-diphosphatase
MSILQAIFYGLLQGATEFLPVSSSGHLVLIPWLFGWNLPGLTFDAIMHLATLLAVLVYFRSDLVKLIVAWWRSVRRFKIEDAEARLAWLLIVSAIPAALVGYLFSDFVESLFGSPGAVSAFLLLTGVLLFLSDRLGRRTTTLQEMGLGTALIMGVAQALAVVPGLSRSGATMASGLFRDMKRDDAARFAFLMGIPVILGAAGFKFIKALPTITSSELLLLAVAFIVAVLVGYLAIRFLLNYLRTRNLLPFAYYCWAIGLIGLAFTLLR